MNSPSAQVHVAIESSGVAWLTLDNPDKLNAMSLPMWHALSDALSFFEGDASVRCVVLTARGDKAFCVGADISQFDEIRSNADSGAEYDRVTRQTLEQLQRFPKPTIAMVFGYCLGAGVALAIACDMRIAATGSRFGIPAAKLGIGYFYTGVKWLADLVGPSSAKRMLFTGEKFSAEEMLRLGFLDELLEKSAVSSRVAALSSEIAANAPLTVSAVKFTIATILSQATPEDIAKCDEMVKACNESEDHAEGRAAFAEKRIPVFRGR